ncbi:hypothetical protein CBOM_07765 [Ceraceosorus bombacis]|uniref:Uncharacterized protein n=1 Tax=Ceraceosorus bombacis TaxID=401625 RepID=A0A0P1BNI6_9BASI|nr:hypothetical protein CBOM_07765 [Ceraceosorus bombacis]
MHSGEISSRLNVEEQEGSNEAEMLANMTASFWPAAILGPFSGVDALLYPRDCSPSYRGQISRGAGRQFAGRESYAIVVSESLETS